MEDRMKGEPEELLEFSTPSMFSKSIYYIYIH